MHCHRYRTAKQSPTASISPLAVISLHPGPKGSSSVRGSSGSHQDSVVVPVVGGCNRTIFHLFSWVRFLCRTGERSQGSPSTAQSHSCCFLLAIKLIPAVFLMKHKELGQFPIRKQQLLLFSQSTVRSDGVNCCKETRLFGQRTLQTHGGTLGQLAALHSCIQLFKQILQKGRNTYLVSQNHSLIQKMSYYDPIQSYSYPFLISSKPMAHLSSFSWAMQSCHSKRWPKYPKKWNIKKNSVIKYLTFYFVHLHFWHWQFFEDIYFYVKTKLH